MTNKFERTKGTAIAAAVGCVFMEIMGEYQDRQHNDPDFDVDAGLYDLYVDLSNLYNDNLND